MDMDTNNQNNIKNKCIKDLGAFNIYYLLTCFFLLTALVKLLSMVLALWQC